MKRYSAQYILTNTGLPLKRAVITTHDDGTIHDIEENQGNLEEHESVEFHNGIIVPGFVNCHCHLELSHLKGAIPRGEGLGNFIFKIRNNRRSDDNLIIDAADRADNAMYNEGIVLCADICNTSVTFNHKRYSKIKYINLIEVFGIDHEKADIRMNETINVAESAENWDLPYSMVPHAVYSTSLPLLRLLKAKSDNNRVTSIHFMETPGEKSFLENHSGPFMESYEKSGLLPAHPDLARNHADAILNEVTPYGNLILVHNTFADSETIAKVNTRGNIYWCLCPNSNIFIENQIPPVKLLMSESCEIVLGTDSLSSNDNLSILEEMKTLQLNFPDLSINDLTRWATVNGARALGMDDKFGKIEPGKNPGLLLIRDVDLKNMKLLPESVVTRLV